MEQNKNENSKQIKLLQPFECLVVLIILDGFCFGVAVDVVVVTVVHSMGS